MKRRAWTIRRGDVIRSPRFTFGKCSPNAECEIIEAILSNRALPNVLIEVGRTEPYLVDREVEVLTDTGNGVMGVMLAKLQPDLFDRSSNYRADCSFVVLGVQEVERLFCDYAHGRSPVGIQVIAQRLDQWNCPMQELISFFMSGPFPDVIDAVDLIGTIDEDVIVMR